MADPQPDGKELRERAQKWLDRIEQAGKEERDWLADASTAVSAYTGEIAKDGGAVGEVYDFNILFSNVETIVPAIINSPPAPDIRRRFGETDQAAKDFAEILERTIRVQVDDGRLQAEMEAMAQDAFLPGRGLIRLRFKSEFQPLPDDKAELLAEAEAADTVSNDDDEEKPNDPPAERTYNEHICCEVVSWKDFRHGKAKRWADVPWQAFRVIIASDDASSFSDPDLVDRQRDPGERAEADTDDLIVWEIWDKKTRQVHFIDERRKRFIRSVDDPLGLVKFFPTHDPVQAIEVTGRLTPVTPFKIYKRLADELNTTTARIRIITEQLKVKGWYSGDATDLNTILDAGDNEFVPLANAELWAAKGGVDKAIGFWPTEKLVVVLKELYALREQTKQAIYEITGISDIVRGASRAGETLGAQQIKTQWGSLRIQKMQRQMERAGREIFLMMAEIIPAKFSFETLEKITGIQIVPTQQDMTPTPVPPMPSVPPGTPPEQVQAMQQQAAAQVQQAEQARQAKLQGLMQLQALMKEKPSTYYRIDVETDSTVKADLTRQKAEANEFMGAAGSYFQAVGPLVQQGALPMNVAVEIFASFSRLFNLGKTVEDALDELLEEANKRAGQPKEQKPSPEQMKAEAEIKASGDEHALKLDGMKQDNTFKAQKGEIDVQRAEIDRRGAAADLTTKEAKAKTASIELKMAQAQAGQFFGLPVSPQPVNFNAAPVGAPV